MPQWLTGREYWVSVPQSNQVSGLLALTSSRGSESRPLSYFAPLGRPRVVWCRFLWYIRGKVLGSGIRIDGSYKT